MPRATVKNNTAPESSSLGLDSKRHDSGDGKYNTPTVELSSPPKPPYFDSQICTIKSLQLLVAEVPSARSLFIRTKARDLKSLLTVLCCFDAARTDARLSIRLDTKKARAVQWV